MKLSEALVLRSDLQKRIQQVQHRLKLSALVQEGEDPDEDPQALLRELDGMLDELQSLIARINRTNLTATLASGATVTASLAERDVLRARIGSLRMVADAASDRSDRYSRTEIKSVATVDVGDLRRRIDRLSLQYRELDTAIQASNWATDLAG